MFMPAGNPTEMYPWRLVHMGQEKEGWKIQAETLFFKEHRKINDICPAVGRTRKYVSAHLQGCAGYAE